MKIAALVIGIDHYTYTQDFTELNCAVNDAREVAEKLRTLKIDVEECLDENNDTCIAYYDNFISKLTVEPHDVAVFYFAGHGERPNLQDSLILKDAKRSRSGDTALLKQSFQVNSIIKDMNAAGDQMNILILDACRIDSGRGVKVDSLATNIKLPFQTFIAFSTSAGDTASDGIAGGHSPFTKALLKYMGTEGLDVEMLFKKVRNEMFSQGLRQYSWEHSCLIDRFCFNHGQLSPHYDSPYSSAAYLSETFVTSSAAANTIISGLKSGENDRIDGAMELLYSNKKSFAPDELFVMGRYLLETCHSPNARRYVNMTHLKLLANGNTNPFLDGVMYAMYFDSKDHFRENHFFGEEVLDDVAIFWDFPEFETSLKFIKEELKPYADNLIYMPGDDVVVINMTVESLDFKSDGHYIWVIKDLECYENKIEVVFENSALTIPLLLEELKHLLFIPRRKIKFRSSPRMSGEDMILPAEPDNVAEILDDYFSNGCESDIDEMGHHYEFCGIEYWDITSLTNDDGLLGVRGTFTISVVVYLDSEEEIKNDVSLDGTFDFSMEYDGTNWETTDVSVKLDTQNYWA